MSKTRGSAVVDVEAALRRLLADADPAGFDEVLESAMSLRSETVRLLRRLARRLADSVRREELLRAVSAIAVDVTERRDVEGVLHEIVRRTRLLTGSDMAYIALNTADTTYIRQSDGVRTEGYRTLRMPIGYGVLGRAATGREIVTTSDYLTDDALTHIDHIDELVRAEGVRSILAVPLTLGSLVHGALLIADRSSRTYPEATVDIVDTLSRHASVALDNARRFEEVTAALARLNARQDADEERMVDLHEVLDLDARLLEALLAGGDLELFARRVRELLGAGVALLDAEGMPLVEDSDGDDEDAPADSLLRLAGRVDPKAISAARGTGRPAVVAGVTVACALAEGELLGTVVVDRPLAERLLPRLQRVAVFLGIILLLGRAERVDRRHRDRAVIEALVRGGREVELVRGEAIVRAMSRGTPYRLVTIETFDADVASLADALRDGTRQQEAVVALHGDHLCVLAPDAAAARLAALLDVESRGINAGWSPAVTDAERIPAAHRAAGLALRSLSALGARGRSAHGEQIGVVGLMAEALHRDPSLPSPLEAIRPLEEYDAAHGTELTATAWTFAESGRHVPGTAEALHVHANTVRQRLERIGTLLGDDWRSPSRFLDLHFALRMWSLARQE